MAWQQRSIARMEAAVNDSEPVFPRWLPEVNPDGDESPDRLNAWLYEIYRDQPWSKVHQDWRTGYLRYLELSAQIAETDLLDSERYPWMEGYALGVVLLLSYHHHLEHYEGLHASKEPPNA